jgi:hypothetical protein
VAVLPVMLGCASLDALGIFPKTAPAPAPPPAPAGPPPLGKSGAFGAGINVELLALGGAQAISTGGAEGGLAVATMLQLDLGVKWALRIPLAFDVTTTGGQHGGFADLSISPGVLHRWRSHADQRWIPYVGGGVKLGGFEAGHELLGQPIVTTAALDFDHHHGSGSHDPNVEFRLRAAPEVWVGVEWHSTSWFALDLGATYAWTRIAGENVHLVRELLGVRFSF